MKIAYSGFLMDPTGYGEAARRTVMALLEAKLDVRPAPVPFGLLTDGSRPIRPPQPIAEFLTLTPHNDPDVHVIHAIGDQFPQVARIPGAFRVGMTCWETDLPHPAIVAGCKQVDRVIVPCTQNMDAFARVGVPARLVPYPIMPPSVEMDDIPAIASLKSSHIFLWVGTWQPRKNPGGVVAAFLLACAQNPALAERAALVMKVSGPLATSVAKNEISTIKGMLNLDIHPEIHVVSMELSAARLAWLHRKSCCYVSLSRGEGFGFGLADALWAGKAIISTDWGGQTDFLDNKIGVTAIPSRMVPVTQMYPLFSGKQSWADPDLRKAQQAIYEVIEDFYAPGRVYVRDISEFTPPAVAARFQEAIRD